VVEDADDVHNRDGVRVSAAEREPGVGKDTDDHVLLHGERPRVKGELHAPHRPERPPRQDAGQQVAERPHEELHLHLADHERLGAVGEELVDEAHERARQEPDGPRPERAHRHRGIEP